MIISNKLKCIFIAVPKTATHAIRFALRKHLDEEMDWEQVGLFEQKKLPFDTLAKISTGHIKAQEAKSVLSDELWSSYFKFVVVRNPYDRFVSYCTFINREDRHFAKNALEIMKQTINNPQTHERILFRPQFEFVCNEKGKLMVDFVGHFEQLQAGYNQICTALDVPSETLLKINRSIRNPFVEYYDEELRAAVFEFYQQDFELFGYSEDL